jgi:hypothetical protein
MKAKDKKAPKEGAKTNKNVRIKLTPVSTMHYIKLVYRSALLLGALAFYVIGKISHNITMYSPFKYSHIYMKIIFAVFVVEMILRFFPSKLESPGCQKQFKRNYIKSGKTEIDIQDNNAVMLVALVWIAFNFIFGALYMLRILDDGIMLLLACAYSVCDMICILFFCPFQTWFMKNKCCSACRIYNWDYAMMFTPLIFIKNVYAWTLLGMSIILLARWEITFYIHPERFAESTNDYLKCANCTEKLCTHKKQLQGLWVKTKDFTAERVRKLKKEQ